MRILHKTTHAVRWLPIDVTLPNVENGTMTTYQHGWVNIRTYPLLEQFCLSALICNYDDFKQYRTEAVDA